MQKTFTNYLTSVIGFGLLLFISITMALTIWEMFKGPDLSYNNLPWNVIPTVIKPGENVEVKLDQCNNTHKILVYEVSKGIKNINTGAVVMLSDIRIPALPGCSNSISLIFTTPKDLPIGVYSLLGYAQITDVVNDKAITFTTTSFEVK